MPDKVAVVDNRGASYTCTALDSAVSSLAAWFLARGIQPGDHIAFQLPGWCRFTIIYLACPRIGAVSVPLLPAQCEAELAQVLNKCKVKISFASTLFEQTRPVDPILPLQNRLPHLQRIVTVDKLAPAAASLALNQLLLAPPLAQTISVHAGELTAVLSISSTEGMPKGVMLIHDNVLASERTCCTHLNLVWQDVFLMPAPLGHATGFLHSIAAPSLVGARSVLLDIFTPATYLELLEQQRHTCVLGVTPSVYGMLCSMEKRPRNLLSLRFFSCGGIIIPQKIAHDCQQLGIKLLNIYDSAEGSPHALVNLDDSLSRMMNIDGHAAAGIKIKVADEARDTSPAGVEGEETSRGPNVFMDYLDEPEPTAHALGQSGWYYSGDLCRMGDTGYIKIAGRKKDIIVCDEESTSSREVEGILLQHPRIHDARIVTTPDERLGERSCAYVVLKPPYHSLSLESVVAFFSRKRVAEYKYPERVVIVEKLPRTVSDRMQEYQLRQDIIQRLSVESITK